MKPSILQNHTLFTNSTLGGAERYWFGFNGKENITEVSGWQDYGERFYNTNIARFFSPDPIIVYGQEYPWYSPYQFAGNKPIWAIDLDGLEESYYYETLSTYRAFSFINNTARKTTLGKQFDITLKAQNKIDVFYFPISRKSSKEGMVIMFSSFNDYLEKKYYQGDGPMLTYDFELLDDKKIEEMFNKSNGKPIIFIGINQGRLATMDYYLKNKQVKEAKAVHKDVSETIIHEETAHAINHLKGKRLSNEEGHKKYFGESRPYSPTFNQLLNDDKYKGTDGQKTAVEIDTDVNQTDY